MMQKTTYWMKKKTSEFLWNLTYFEIQYSKWIFKFAININLI